MALTVNNLGTLTLLNILNRTSAARENVLLQLATGSRINHAADDPAGLVALTGLDAELTSVKAGIANNKRTDAVLSVANGALTEVSKLVSDIQRLASQTASDRGLTANEIAANQTQIDDALAAIDRIVSGTQFNGQKLLDGSLGINYTVANAGAITDVKIFTRQSSSDNTPLTVKVVSGASAAGLTSVMTTSTPVATTFSVQGKLGTAVISVTANEKVSSVAYKVNQAKGQTGVSAVLTSSAKVLNLYSTAKGTDAFVRTQLITGNGVTSGSKSGVDAVVTVNGQNAAVGGNHVAYTGGGVGVSFDVGTLGAGSTTTLTVKGTGGATFQLGANSNTRATIGIDGLYTYELGNAADGYLATLKSGGGNSLLQNSAKAADIARVAAQQVAQVQSRVGGFQKYQVRSAIDSLSGTAQGLEKARSVINDVDYAAATAELNRQNLLLQSAVTLLGLVNQQSAQVLSLLK